MVAGCKFNNDSKEKKLSYVNLAEISFDRYPPTTTTEMSELKTNHTKATERGEIELWICDKS
jgi:hypothetical protein